METDLSARVEFNEDNLQPRCACVLLLDTSGSMHGEKINALNNGLCTFKEEWLEDPDACLRVEAAIVSFNDKPEVVCDFKEAMDFDPPKLTVGGLTHMGAAIHQGLNMLDERKRLYRTYENQYYRPWLVLITDGKSVGEEPGVFEGACERLKAKENGQNVEFWAIGVQHADLTRLKETTNYEPHLLKGLEFKKLFKWLSNSLKVASTGERSQKRDYSPPTEEQNPFCRPG